MGFSKITTALVSSLLLLGHQVSAIDPIVMKGTKFFYQNGTQFFIKGIAYQQDAGGAGNTTGGTGSTTFTDPLKDASICQRDIPLMQALGTNTIRTYAIDPTADHSQCMSMLADAGIYVISDLSEPSLSINRDTPAWNTQLFNRYKAVVDELSKYENVIGFFAGNEVTNNNTNTPASAYVKAAVRDTKAYIASKGGRWLGVGYAANDDADIRANIAHYFNCGNQSEAIDYWGYNIYEWCGQNTFQGSGYSTQVDFFKNYSVPVFFAEYGCNTQGGAANRIWQETTALYSDQMTGVISGGIVYMYFQEANDYGLVSIVNNKASTLKDYDTLKTVIASVKPSSTAMSAYSPTNSPATCPGVGGDWVASNSLPPTPNDATCNCMFASLACVPAPSLQTKAYGQLFGNICGTKGNPCAGINGNVSTGVFGAFSMCNDTQKLGYVLDQYYQSQGAAASACDWGSQAQVVKPAKAASTCASLLSSASASNSFAATATAGGSGGASSNVAVPIPIRNAFTIGDLAVGLYVLVAMCAGAGMVML